MTPLQKNVLIGAVCAVVGFFAGRQQMQYQIATAMALAFSGVPSAPSVSLHPVAPKKPSEALAKIIVSGVSLNHDSFSTTMAAHAKNTTSSTIAGFDLQYSLLSPGREVPWDKGDVRFQIDGGLAPGEERDVKSYAMGLAALKNAMAQHPEAVLNVGVSEATLPNGAQMD